MLGSHVSNSGVRADPEKVSSMCSWPTPTGSTELRQCLGLANYLNKYTKDYVGSIQPLSPLLKKDAKWSWHPKDPTAHRCMEKEPRVNPTANSSGRLQAIPSGLWCV